MPKYNECSIYEEACRNGTCNHSKNASSDSLMDWSSTTEKTPGQIDFEKWAELFMLYTANWEDLPDRTKQLWEKHAEVVAMYVIEKNDMHG